MKKNLNKRLAGLLVFSVATFVLVATNIRTQAASNHFETYMRYGMKSAEISKLQTFLAAEPTVYPSGLVTGYFGPLTKAAVEQFQIQYGLVPDGIVGPNTRGELNKIVDTNLPLDVNAATISGSSIQTNFGGATISWSTNDSTRGAVYYSTQPINLKDYDDTGRGFRQNRYNNAVLAIANNGNLNTSQNVSLTGLSSGVRYYYIIETIDASGNITITMPNSFVAN